MISVKQAAQAAEAFAKNLYPEGELQLLRLEEAELADDESAWRITLGWMEPAVGYAAKTAAELFVRAGNTEKLPRVYKTFLVDRESGEVKSMRIRNVAA